MTETNLNNSLFLTFFTTPGFQYNTVIQSSTCCCHDNYRWFGQKAGNGTCVQTIVIISPRMHRQRANQLCIRTKVKQFIMFMMILIIINPILIRVSPRKWGWPDLSHSNSNLSNSHSPSRSMHGILFLQTNALASPPCIFHIFFGCPRFL